MNLVFRRVNTWPTFIFDQWTTNIPLKFVGWVCRLYFFLQTWFMYCDAAWRRYYTISRRIIHRPPAEKEIRLLSRRFSAGLFYRRSPKADKFNVSPVEKKLNANEKSAKKNCCTQLQVFQNNIMLSQSSRISGLKREYKALGVMLRDVSVKKIGNVPKVKFF